MCVRCAAWCYVFIFFFKQKTAYDMRISDWSSEVCSSDLPEPVDVLDVDNTQVREGQVALLAKIRAGRDDAACTAALDALREGAAGNGNLLALCIEAARARATVGEMSDAMEIGRAHV